MSFRNVVCGFAGVGLGGGLVASFWGLPFGGNSRAKGNVVDNVSGSVTSGGSEGSLKLSGSDVNPSAFFKYGFPGPVHDLHNREEYVSCYDRRLKLPYWVVEHITPESLANKSGDRKNSFFKEDESIPDRFRAKLRDYFRSGYDRGHMAPAANAKFNQRAMDETFMLTNIAPQVGEGFNRDYWAHFEYFCRQLTQKYGSVRILTGPLFLPKRDPADGKNKVTYEVIGNPPSIAVPTHFYKVIVAESPLRGPGSDNVAVAAFVLPNDKISNETKLTDFEVPLDAVSRSTGLQLLQKLPSEKKKELCKEVDCHITVREFVKALPAPKSVPSLPSPSK
ncbi:ribonuclease [Lachancea thermotolerans CBS 6340]|uniref:Endonuclease n=1 Tax=Lachancea thermotolerans (strain ATCC 56472 / CBS 6340 / NRRL Y-8284) TaxID=559295 RepID=C5DKC0_LACTC|nr:KLTH0F03366p [Lachancea thermotolerans CBS 6340]CAR23921.1 KLTH0F03366p [Lachancea thermotolerans CBS 6340]